MESPAAYKGTHSTRDLVFLAADSFARQGVKPTAQAVMQQIGRGSKSTVVDALNDWWLQTLPKGVDAGKPEDIPEEAFDLVKRLHGILSEAAEVSAKEQAEKAFAAARATFGQELKMARVAAESAERERDITRDRAEREVEHRKHIEEKLAKAQADAEELRERLTNMVAKHDAALASLTGKEETIRALQESKQEIEVRAAKQEQQAIEREQALKTQVSELQAEQREQNSRFDRERLEQSLVATELRDLATTLRADIQREREEHAIAKEEAAALASVRKELNDRTKALANAKTEMAKIQSAQDLALDQLAKATGQVK